MRTSSLASSSCCPPEASLLLLWSQLLIMGGVEWEENVLWVLFAEQGKGTLMPSALAIMSAVICLPCFLHHPQPTMLLQSLPTHSAF